MNEKYFPKRARFIITNQIIESTMNVAKNFNIANNIFPNKEENVKFREQYQAIGKANLISLEHQLNLCNRLFNIPSSVLEEIFDMINEIKSKYSNWVKSARKTLKRELEKINNEQLQLIPKMQEYIQYRY